MRDEPMPWRACRCALLAISGPSHIHIHSFWPSWVSLSLPDGFTFTFTTVPGSARPIGRLTDGLQMTHHDRPRSDDVLHEAETSDLLPSELRSPALALMPSSMKSPESIPCGTSSPQPRVHSLEFTASSSQPRVHSLEFTASSSQPRVHSPACNSLSTSRVRSPWADI
jgi:hypothetical protein